MSTSLTGPLRNDDGEFVYACFLTSLLDGAVRPERIGFEIPDTAQVALDSGDPPMSGVRDAAQTLVQRCLRPTLGDSIVMVKIEHPMRSDSAPGQEKDPIAQMFTYLERVREGKVTTASGRLIPGADQIPVFIYVIADLTPTVAQRCMQYNLNPTPDGLGFFGFNPNYRVYIEVNSFDRLGLPVG